MKTDDMASMLEQLMDREAIRDCLFRYCRAIDRHDEALLRTVYWPEARDFHGAFNGPVSEFIPFVMELGKSLENIAHNLGNIIIQLDGHKAHVESYFFGSRAGAVFKGSDDVVAAQLAAGADPDAGTPSARDTAQMFGRFLPERG